MDWPLELREIQESVHICESVHLRFDGIAADSIQQVLRNAPLGFLRASPTPICMSGETLFFGCQSVAEARRLGDEAAEKVSVILSGGMESGITAEIVVTPQSWLGDKFAQDREQQSKIWLEEKAREDAERERRRRLRD